MKEETIYTSLQLLNTIKKYLFMQTVYWLKNPILISIAHLNAKVSNSQILKQPKSVITGEINEPILNIVRNCFDVSSILVEVGIYKD